MPGNFFEMCAVPAIIVATADVLSVQIGMTEYPARWHVVLAVVWSLLISAINTAILVFAGVDGLTMLCSATLYLPLALKGLLFRKYSDGRSIFSLTSIALFIQFEACLSLIWLDANARGPLLFTVSLGGLSLVAVLLVQHFARDLYRSIQEKIESGWVVYSLLPIVGNAFVLVCFLLYRHLEVYMVLTLSGIAFLFAFISLGTFFYFFKRLYESVNLEADVRMLRSQQQIQENLERERRENENKERRIRHDQRHFYQVMIDELDCGEVDEVREKLVRLRGDNLVPDFDYCKNLTVNSILKVWSYRAQDQGIDMQIRADVPEKLDIDSMELGSLVSNLLENAYEACLRLERSERQRFIDFTMTYHRGKLICQIKNSSRDDVSFDSSGLPASQKHGAGGIGTRSARTSVERYGGQIRYSLADGVFTTRFILGV